MKWTRAKKARGLLYEGPTMEEWLKDIGLGEESTMEEPATESLLSKR